MRRAIPSYAYIIPSNHREEMCMLREFWEEFKEDIAVGVVQTATVTAIGAPNQKWEVHLVEDQGELYFRDGWRKYMDDLRLGKYNVLILDYQENLSFHVSFIYKSPGFGGTNMNKNGLIVITDDEDVNNENWGPIVISDDEDLVESAEEGDYIADVANGDKDSGIISLGPNPPVLSLPNKP